MKLIRSYGPLLRAAGVLSVVGILVTGVTFATLQSQQASLTGSTIQSATADLRIGTSASTFAPSRSGFTFQDVVPGGPAMPTDGHTFYLKNYGTATLNLKTIIGSTPTVTGNVDLNKVKLQLTRVDTEAAQTASVQALKDGGLALTNTIAPGAVVQYKLRAVMDADAFDGTGASVGAIDLVFSGTAAN
jgi:hypothetical protein